MYDINKNIINILFITINASDLVLPLSKCIHNSEKKIEIHQFAATSTYAKVYIKTIKVEMITGQTKGVMIKRSYKIYRYHEVSIFI